MDKIKEFVLKKRTIHEVKTVKIPWYKRPLEKSEFYSRKGRDGKLYIQHNEWSKKIWIGPYETPKEVNSIINAYVSESLKMPLDRKQNANIHSLTIDDEKDFFLPLK